MRVPVDYRTADKKNYINFCKENPEISISFDDWKLVIYSYNEAFREHILETGEDARMPAGFGDFSIRKRKRKRFKEVDGEMKVNLPIDWKKTREKGKKIYNLNYHTDGYYFGWVWLRKFAMVRHADLWYFKPFRTTSRLLNHYIKISDEYQHKYSEWASYN